MREVEFRARDRHDKEWVYFKPGYLVLFKDGTLQQWTGLTDKNGVRIYEGDLIQHSAKTPPEKVEWVKVVGNFDNGFVGFNIEPEVDEKTDELLDYLPNYEIIGNIYENPELLENKKK